MNDVQLEQAKKQLFSEGGSYCSPKGTVEQRKQYYRLHCIDMINSIIAYDYPYESRKTYSGEDVLKRQEAHRHNYLAGYVEELGRDEVIRLIEEQMRDVDCVRIAVHTDSEGLTYNSIVWKN